MYKQGGHACFEVFHFVIGMHNSLKIEILQFLVMVSIKISLALLISLQLFTASRKLSLFSQTMNKFLTIFQDVRLLSVKISFHLNLSC